MLNFSAESYYSFGRALRDIKADCHIAAAVCKGGDVGFDMIRPIDDMAREKAINHLHHVARCSEQIGMQITAATAAELVERLRSNDRQNFQWLYDQIGNVEGIANKELKNKAFFYIPPERMKYWPTMDDPHVFGKDVAERFPSATFDIRNSAFCLATTLSTAAVFHLMRVLEIGLSVMGAKFNVSLAHTNWAPAIEEIESKIRNMHKDLAWKALPDCKEQQAFYSQAASHFVIVKDAVRNQTMHVRAKYTWDEAEQMFNSVKAFMQKLAERLKE